MKQKKRMASCIVNGVVLSMLSLPPLLAGPADYVHTPSVDYGEREIELHLGTLKSNDEGRESAAVLYYGMGVTPWWFSEVGGEFEKTRDKNTRLEAIEWENYFLISEPGEYAIDVGLLVETEFASDKDDGWELKTGPLLQSDFGRVQMNFNPLLERKFNTGQPEQTILVYEMQLKYRDRPKFEYGLQAFGELGEWDHWQDASLQTHKLGPALFGKLPLHNHQSVKYDVAALIGLNDNTPNSTLRATLEYEF